MADNETLADIIAWLRRPREGENAYLALWRDEIADRLEAAHEREAAFHAMTCEANDRLREHLQIALDTDKRKCGDAAKLREAVVKIEKMAHCDLCNVYPKYRDKFNAKIGGIEREARAALSAPPRNCDRFVSAEQAWDAYDEWVESYRSKGKTEPFNEFGWLFAPATEQEGGANV